MANLNITIESYKNNVHLFYCKKKVEKIPILCQELIRFSEKSWCFPGKKSLFKIQKLEQGI